MVKYYSLTFSINGCWVSVHLFSDCKIEGSNHKKLVFVWYWIQIWVSCIWIEHNNSRLSRNCQSSIIKGLCVCLGVKISLRFELSCELYDRPFICLVESVIHTVVNTSSSCACQMDVWIWGIIINYGTSVIYHKFAVGCSQAIV